MKILMVCLGNICRSPLAEGILKALVAERELNWLVDSAGTNGYHVGEAPHHLSQKVAKKNGLDICDQVARRFSIKDFDEFDRIYVMAEDVLKDIKYISGKNYKPEKIDYFLNILFPGENRDVTDPWYGAEEGYDVVYKQIYEACEKLIEQESGVKNN